MAPVPSSKPLTTTKGVSRRLIEVLALLMLLLQGCFLSFGVDSVQRPSDDADSLGVDLLGDGAQGSTDADSDSDADSDADCAANETLCGEVCADTQTNTSHCGGCDQACAPGQICASGGCVCVGGDELCDDVCVDIAADADHCGGCGLACPDSEVCNAGTCSPMCDDADLTACSGDCVDTQTNAEHCGACGAACLEGEHAQLRAAR